MSTATYRAVVRELYKASVSSPATRNRAIASCFRSIFEKPRSGNVSERFEHDMQDAITFMRSQRMHKTLLERYNPLHDMSTEERVKATARRVGLDMPVKPGGDGGH